MSRARPIGLQRLGPPAAPVQGIHQQGMQMLAERRVHGELLCLSHKLSMSAQLQAAVELLESEPVETQLAVGADEREAGFL